jgi:hypothetical protein
MDIKMGWKDRGWILSFKDKDVRWAFVKTATEVRVP